MKENYDLFFCAKKKLTKFSFGKLHLLIFFIFYTSWVLAQLPNEFSKVELASGLANTTTFKFAPDGRIFILNRYGEVLIYKSDSGFVQSAGNIPVFHELEDGLLGIAFDPNFLTNNYIYLTYSPMPVDANKNRLSRFTMNGDDLDQSSEVVLLEWDTSRVAKFHSGGDMDFDSKGNLYIATGDNTTYPPGLYSAISETSEVASAEKSSSNTNDLRGKILRIIPQADGTYTIPTGNLFPGGTGGLPEIYVMGARNPYRIFVDDERNDWLFWGEVGPDAPSASALGPAGKDEINLTKEAANHGWPYFLGDSNEAYDINVGVGSPSFNNPLAPENNSIWNTGAKNLPAAQPALMSFDNRCYLAGFRYTYNARLTDVQRLPIEFDGVFFFYDFNSSKIWAVTLDASGKVIEDTSTISAVPRFAPVVFPTATEGFIDMELGPDGKMYILAYGVQCCNSDSGPTGKLIRVDYTGITTNSPPVIKLVATPTNGDLPLEVSFSTEGTTDPNGDSPLTYEWDFDSDGTIDARGPNPTYTYTTAGTFNAQVKVNDGNAINGQSIKNITIYAGNNLATFTVKSPVDGGLFNWADDVDIDIDVRDEEDGLVDCKDVIVVPGFGHLNHVHPESSINSCPRTITIGADDNHGTDGELDIFGSISLEYTDDGGLISRDLITLHPKRKEAEFYSTQSGTTIISNTDPLEGGQEALSVNSEGYISFSGRNLLKVDAVKYKVAAAAAGGSIEMRVGSPTGTLLATTSVPNTGGTNSWVSIETAFTDPGGKNDLFFVFKGSGSNIFNLNYVEFLGDGISTDNSPPTVEKVSTIGTTTVAIQFSEYVNQSTAEAVSNYTIDNGVLVSTAVLQSDGRTVFLTTSNINGGIAYLLTINNVQNTAGLGIPTDRYPFSAIAETRLNTGGSEITAEGNVFIADKYNIGGSLFKTTEAIAGTINDELYQTERFATGTQLAYEIPVGSSGKYDIRLHFAEIFFGVGDQAGGSGSRVFNVSIEGNRVLSNFDILSEVAPATALIKEFNDVVVNDGFASILFENVVQSAKVSAIEVLAPNTFNDPTDSDIVITSPLNNWSVNQPFEVAFTVANWTILKGDTHVHYYIDDMMIGPHYNYEPIVIDDLSLGQHTIKIELFNADHSGTGIFDEVTVNVRDRDTITCNETLFPTDWGVKQLETSSLPQVSVYTFADFDLDGDGLKDIVTGGWWYKNPGNIQGNWIRNTIGNDFDNVVWVYDFDDDGDLDLLGTTDDENDPFGYEGSDLVWAQNNGTGVFRIFNNIPSGNTTYVEPFLAGIAGGVFTEGGQYQMAINWNGAESSGSPMQMLTPTSDPTNGTWTLVDMIGATSTGEDIQAGDIDQDGDLDLFQGTNWIRNNGGTWETISTGISYVTTADRAQLADFDRDGDLDAVVGQLGFGAGDNPARFELAWWEAPTDPTQPWTKRLLDTEVKGSLSVFAIDIDYDGDKDIVVGEWLGQNRLIVFENDLCDSGNFIKQIINDGITGQEHHDGARVTDLDNDGDLDVVSNGWFVESEIRNFPRIYENQSVPIRDDKPLVDAGPDQNILPDSATLNGSANDPDGGAITSYLWTQVSGPNTATLVGNTTATLTASGLIEGVYVFKLTATDDENDTGFDEATITVSSQPDAIRINSGGPTYTFDSLNWSQDQYFNAGTKTKNAIAIANTENDQLYQTERFHTGDLLYEIPVSNGDYNVNLHFAEIFYGVPGDGSAGGVGSRVFNVDIEGGEGILTNYDIIAEAGGSATAIIENFTNVTVNDGNLSIKLTGVTEFPKISGIEVIVPGNEDAPIVFAGDDRTITLPSNSLTLDGSATDPDGGTIASYSWTQVSGPNTASFSDTSIADPNVSGLIEGNYVFNLKAVDDEGDSESDLVTITVASEPSSLFINSGGPSFTFNDEDWIIDQHFVGGTPFPTTPNPIPIANTENDELYQTERFSTSGTLLYEIPVVNGNYNVDLHFAELFYGVGSQPGGIGARVFNIQVEGEPQISNFDIIEAAGGSATAIIKSFSNVAVTDGMLTIRLTGVTEFPKISGIGVFETRTPDVNAGANKTITLPTNSINLNGTGKDPDGGTVSYAWTQESGPSTATLTGDDTANLMVSNLIEGEYVFRLSVTDDERDTAFDEVTVIVKPKENTSKITVDLGEDITITLPKNNVALDATVSSEAGGIVYKWSQQVGPSMNAVLKDTDTSSLSVTNMEAGEYRFRLTATDSDEDSAFDEITVNVLPADLKRNIYLEYNPPKSGEEFVTVKIENRPETFEVMNFAIHDVGGRYIDGYLASNDNIKVDDNTYKLPISNLSGGLYFIKVIGNEGKPSLIKVLISN